MKQILLLCAAGMSTSLLVTKMRQVASDKNLQVEIEADSVSNLDKKLKEKEIDVILLGPQVGFMKKDVENKVKQYDIPVALINMQDYGMMNGEKVLLDGIKNIKE
ncbi:PTS sugar transporter subunit IIB [Fundicoccus culcitae]|uniref:PTS sugar transporter subunit IIB n=1 Tax=Fundicoccus culcitae TaxID=2969821 RepID=A0ABY5P8W1_9LACT|nr:PTS sugar transporter subunit IIB [Fundicoccus culcitae]UUX35201.1 PTS sugar transporter subunit IIB [Fundicoccus culcitae]